MVDSHKVCVESLVERLLEITPRPTGLFVPSDSTTARVYASLTQKGIMPGKDIEIVSAGYERPFLAGLYPCPTVVDTRNEHSGVRAAKQLLWRMANEDGGEQVLVKIKPVLRNGTNLSNNDKVW